MAGWYCRKSHARQLRKTERQGQGEGGQEHGECKGMGLSHGSFRSRSNKVEDLGIDFPPRHATRLQRLMDRREHGGGAAYQMRPVAAVPG